MTVAGTSSSCSNTLEEQIASDMIILCLGNQWIIVRVTGEREEKS